MEDKLLDGHGRFFILISDKNNQFMCNGNKRSENDLSSTNTESESPHCHLTLSKKSTTQCLGQPRSRSLDTSSNPSGYSQVFLLFFHNFQNRFLESKYYSTTKFFGQNRRCPVAHLLAS